MYNFSDKDYEEEKPRTVPLSVIEKRKATQDQRYLDFLVKREHKRRAKIEQLGYDYDSLTGWQQNALLRGDKI